MEQKHVQFLFYSKLKLYGICTTKVWRSKLQNKTFRFKAPRGSFWSKESLKVTGMIICSLLEMGCSETGDDNAVYPKTPESVVWDSRVPQISGNNSGAPLSGRVFRELVGQDFSMNDRPLLAGRLRCSRLKAGHNNNLAPLQRYLAHKNPRTPRATVGP